MFIVLQSFDACRQPETISKSSHSLKTPCTKLKCSLCPEALTHFGILRLHLWVYTFRKSVVQNPNVHCASKLWHMLSSWDYIYEVTPSVNSLYKPICSLCPKALTHVGTLRLPLRFYTFCKSVAQNPNVKFASKLWHILASCNYFYKFTPSVNSLYTPLCSLFVKT